MLGCYDRPCAARPARAQPSPSRCAASWIEGCLASTLRRRDLAPGRGGGRFTPAVQRAGWEARRARQQTCGRVRSVAEKGDPEESGGPGDPSLV
jgi:hypothetical protein